MLSGKKATAESIVYGAMQVMEARIKKPALELLEQGVRNATPMIEVRPRRVGGATYQVPMEIREDRRMALALRWLIASSRKRSGKTMAEKLAAELMDASQNQGATVKKREDTHKMAEANRAFAHYRW
jgi:small subunit ribosomal protein S7